MARNYRLPIGAFVANADVPEELFEDLLRAIAARAPGSAREFKRQWDLCEEWGDEENGILLDMEDLLAVWCPPFTCLCRVKDPDRAALGCFPDWEALENAVHEGEVWRDPDNGSATPRTAAYRLVVNDHGNATLYFRNGKEVWSCA